MLRPVAEAYQHIEDARPLVRPTYNQFEVAFLPPYGDPEVHIPGEIGTYVTVCLLVSTAIECLTDG